jgi:hypothetical protein
MKPKKTDEKEINTSSKKKTTDRHLDIPSEANRDKHINFTALENNEMDPSDEPARGRLAKIKRTRNNQRIY